MFAVETNCRASRQHLSKCWHIDKPDERYTKIKGVRASLVSFNMHETGVHHKSDPIIIGKEHVGDSAHWTPIAEFDSTKHLRQMSQNQFGNNSLRLQRWITNEWTVVYIADDEKRWDSVIPISVAIIFLWRTEGQHIHIIANRIDLAGVESSALWVGIENLYKAHRSLVNFRKSLISFISDQDSTILLKYVNRLVKRIPSSSWSYQNDLVFLSQEILSQIIDKQWQIHPTLTFTLAWDQEEVSQMPILPLLVKWMASLFRIQE